MSENRAEPKAQSKKKHFKEQFEEEDTLLVFRKHPIVMRKGLILASFGMLVGPLYSLILIYADKNHPPSIAFFAAARSECSKASAKGSSSSSLMPRPRPTPCQLLTA